MGHIHAAAMAEYAKDAAETDMPWERWEFSMNSQDYKSLHKHPSWGGSNKYRRKPKTILINGHKVPEPQRTPLKDGEVYWTFTFADGAIDLHWLSDDEDNRYLRNGFVHLTREAAEKHFNALKSFTAKGEQ